MLSICISSLYDYDLLNKTIKAFYRPDIEFSIVLDSAQEYPDLSEFDDYNNIKIYKSNHSLGSSQGKQLAVSKSIGDIIMILDGHMKPLTDNWFDLVQNVKNDGIYFASTYAYQPYNDDKVKSIEMSGCCVGSSEKSLYPYCLNNLEFYPICMGACYIMTRSWWDYIEGFNHLIGYGHEELFISLKTWGLGGSVKIIPGLKMAHAYAKDKKKSKQVLNLTSCVNNLLTSLYALMDEEDRNKILNYYKRFPTHMDVIKDLRYKISDYYKIRDEFISKGYDYIKFKTIHEEYKSKYVKS